MRINKSNEFSAEQIRDFVVRGMLEKKGQDIVVMDLRNVKNAICDYFVLCSGNSDTQIDAISTSIEEEVYKASRQDPWHKEGKLNREWILLDYVDVVAHVFKKDRRSFYDLEQLWGDAEIQHIDESMLATVS
ncbi:MULTISPECIES: ribosome silencing factor [Spirosoma]|jgi:ribosome-associated protein|uniref:Ribosomal silencing factor RsfS n=2 Tax=Spirosoma TaxID=107 RepID=A0A6G9AWM0_9BACT|nr:MULTISPECIES: ribosome silencing factor [Spirosoma]QHV97243.1 ribosome silencing factor [Spirosoma endbachense]QIP16764.1 ribosome silencing factor [Spirosoma aureum]